MQIVETAEFKHRPWMHTIHMTERNEWRMQIIVSLNPMCTKFRSFHQLIPFLFKPSLLIIAVAQPFQTFVKFTSKYFNHFSSIFIEISIKISHRTYRIGSEKAQFPVDFNEKYVSCVCKWRQSDKRVYLSGTGIVMRWCLLLSNQINVTHILLFSVIYDLQRILAP